MKFLCMACDEAMRLQAVTGPDEGSLAVTFACPACQHRVAMLTNPWETQLVRTLGVKVGGAPRESAPFAPAQFAPAPFAEVRGNLAYQRAVGGAGSIVAGSEPGATSMKTEAGEGPSCPFAAMIPGYGSAASTDGPAWTDEAEARVERIPAFIRPMARQAIARFAQERGYGTVTEAVMDEARTAIGM